MFRLIHATPIHPSLCLPHSNPTVTVTIATVSLLLFHCYCCYYKLFLLINFCEQELFSGAAELTTQLLRLASILCLPLCRINKLGNTILEDCYDPYTCGSSRLFSGAVAGEHSFICMFTW